MADIEVRLLGTLGVRRVDGTPVGAAEWRTAMTRGLLTLLALRAPNPVPVDVVLETIWPGVEPSRSRPRLRTAASQIRKAVGANIIHREGDALVLRGVQVDVPTFSHLAAEVRHHLVLGDLDAALATATTALELYAGDLCEHLPYADWIDGSRAQLRSQHLRLLEDVAGAHELREDWPLAVAAAEQAARIDPCSEAACRVLMRAHRAMGEMSAALIAYERCRSALVESLGADPSAQTELLHRSLLRRVDRNPAVGYVGRSDLLAWLRSTVLRAFTTKRPALVHLVGAPGSGKSRMLDELDRRVRSRAVLVRLQPAPGVDGGAYQQILRHAAVDPADGRPGGLAVTRPTLVCVDDGQWADAESLRTLAAEMAGLCAPLAVVVAGTRLPDGLPTPERLRRVPALRPAEVAELAAAVLGRPLPAYMLEGVLDSSGGVPGAVIEDCLRLVAAGLVPRTERVIDLRDRRWAVNGAYAS